MFQGTYPHVEHPSAVLCNANLPFDLPLMYAQRVAIPNPTDPDRPFLESVIMYPAAWTLEEVKSFVESNVRGAFVTVKPRISLAVARVGGKYESPSVSAFVRDLEPSTHVDILRTHFAQVGAGLGECRMCVSPVYV